MARMAAKSPGDEDLVIIAPDRQFYWVGRDEYRKHPFEIEEGDLYDHLLRAGVVLAQLPPKREDLPPDLGDSRCICYVVNLSSINAQAEQRLVARNPRPTPEIAAATAPARKTTRAAKRGGTRGKKR
jgi:hypothetical protein